MPSSLHANCATGRRPIRLVELVQSLAPGEEIVIKSGDKAVAKITSTEPRPSLRDLKPVSVGAVLRPFPHPDNDLLDEMLNQP